MSDTLHRLTKEIDALTYNARSVLNALNRSVLASSSTNGFTIQRVGYPLQLTRPLIYRLYRFYQEWENKQFKDTDFDTILALHDKIPVKDDTGQVITNSPTTDAIVVHSKILYLNDSNKDQINDTATWLNLIRNANNPKIITNSAPIPLNIRTPIFDENLSTTRFLTHESYLFPYAYFALDALGYSGDGVSHNLDGLSWNINADDYVRIIAPKISLGNLIEDALFKTIDRREGIDSLSWGYDTHARGYGSTAGGASTGAMSPASVAIGSAVLATDNNTASIGGEKNNSTGVNSGVFAGVGNITIGEQSVIVGGVNNVTGDNIFPFDFGSIEGGIFNRNLILITGDVTSSFSGGDEVKLFNFTNPGSPVAQFYDTNGDMYETFSAVISTSVYNSTTTKTEITIDSTVPYVTTIGGVVSVSIRSGIKLGFQSLVTGEGNRSIGQNQTIVGKYNAKLDDALFIVGTGTNDTNRKNGLIVKDGPKDDPSGIPSSEVFAYGVTPSIGTDMLLDPLSYGLNVNNTRALLKAGNSYVNVTTDLVEIKSGSLTTYITLSNSEISLKTFTGATENSQLRLSNVSSNTEYQTTLLRSMTMDIVSTANRISLGTTSTSNNGKVIIYSGLTVPITSAINVTSLTSSVSVIKGINLISNSSINLIWNNPNIDIPTSLSQTLVLTGKTYGALPTTDKQYAHLISTTPLYSNYPSDNLNNNLIRRSGFYCSDAGASNPSYSWVINLGLYSNAIIGTSGTGEGFQLVFPRNLSAFSNNAPIPVTDRLQIRRTTVVGTESRSETLEPLAWLSDVTSDDRTSGSFVIELRTSAGALLASGVTMYWEKKNNFVKMRLGLLSGSLSSGSTVRITAAADAGLPSDVAALFYQYFLLVVTNNGTTDSQPFQFSPGSGDKIVSNNAFSTGSIAIQPQTFWYYKA